MESVVKPYGGQNQPSRISNNFQKMKTPAEQFQQIPRNRLDESVCNTLKEQISSMCFKFSYVLIPRGDGNSKLHSWDLWGPFFMCLIFGLFIDNSNNFILLFFSMFGGAIIVTFNVRVLGGNASFFQSTSILGYCVFPLFLVLMILLLLKFLQLNNIIVRLCLITIGCIWSIISARAFMSASVPQNRVFVAIYPICLFYIFLAVLLNSI